MVIGKSCIGILGKHLQLKWSTTAYNRPVDIGCQNILLTSQEQRIHCLFLDVVTILYKDGRFCNIHNVKILNYSNKAKRT